MYLLYFLRCSSNLGCSVYPSIVTIAGKKCRNVFAYVICNLRKGIVFF